MYSPLSTLSPTDFPSGRSRSSQDLFFTHPGLFIPPPHPPMSSSLAVGHMTGGGGGGSDTTPHVWSPMNLGSPFARLPPRTSSSSAPGVNPWNSALLSAYMLQLLPNTRSNEGMSQPNLSSSPESSAS